jgi:hypothetical protein
VSGLSIISEALKKAQEERLKNPDLAVSPPPPDNPAIAPPKAEVTLSARKRGGYAVPLAAAIVCAAVIAMAGLVFFHKPAPKDITAVTVEKIIPVEPEVAIHVNEPVKTAISPRRVEPEAPLAPMPAAVSQLPVLSGIMYTKSDPKAILNGELCVVGDTISGYRIKKIDPDSIVVDSPDGEKFIKIQ